MNLITNQASKNFVLLGDGNRTGSVGRIFRYKPLERYPFEVERVAVGQQHGRTSSILVASLSNGLYEVASFDQHKKQFVKHYFEVLGGQAEKLTVWETIKRLHGGHLVQEALLQIAFEIERLKRSARNRVMGWQHALGKPRQGTTTITSYSREFAMSDAAIAAELDEEMAYWEERERRLEELEFDPSGNQVNSEGQVVAPARTVFYGQPQTRASKTHVPMNVATFYRGVFHLCKCGVVLSSLYLCFQRFV